MLMIVTASAICQSFRNKISKKCENVQEGPVDRATKKHRRSVNRLRHHVQNRAISDQSPRPPTCFILPGLRPLRLALRPLAIGLLLAFLFQALDLR
jgi:hypothetical protein